MAKKRRKDELQLKPVEWKGRMSKLEMLLYVEPGTYKRFLDFLKLGASLQAAAASIGVHPSTLGKWLRDGQQKVSQDAERFYNDVIEAVGQASVVTEAEVRKYHPALWLRNGPRRLLGDEWRDDVEGKESEEAQNTTVNIELTVHDIRNVIHELKQAKVEVEGLESFDPDMVIEAQYEEMEANESPGVNPSLPENAVRAIGQKPSELPSENLFDKYRRMFDI